MTGDVKEKLTNAVIYLRVSTREQGDSKLGLEAQEEQCRRACEQLGLTVIDVFTEVCTGTKAPLNRPKFKQARDRAKDVRGKLVIAKLDRLSRDFAHTVAYTHDTNEPELIIAENPGMSMIELRLRAIISADEREKISKRTKEALEAKRARGYKFGTEQAKAKKTQALESNASSLMRAVELRKLNLSLQSIVFILTDEGYVNSQGGKWSVSLLSRQLQQHADLFATEGN